MTESKNQYSVTIVNVSFLGLLTLIFITLKLTDHIDWSWWWVLAPLLIPVAIISFILLILVILRLILRFFGGLWT